MQLNAEFFDGRDAERVRAVQRLRKTIFVDGCGWRLLTIGDREADEFDADDTVHGVLSLDGAPCATLRAIRTDRPYLSRSVFPHLAVMSPYPQRRDAWEISRFGIVAGHGPDIAAINYALMFHFALGVGASSLVATAEPIYERYLRRVGIRTRRYGPLLPIGTAVDGRVLQAVAGEIPISQQRPDALSALARLLHSVEISDATALLGPARLSA